MLPESITQALSRVEDRLFADDDASGLLARREAGAAGPDDAERLRTLADGLLRAQAADGSWGGELTSTAYALIRLRELAGDEPNERARIGAGRAVRWLRSRQSAAGRFGDGCSPDRHRHGLCHHFLGGFFSPGPPDRPRTPLRLDTGAELHDETGARLAASCIALRALLRWDVHGTDTRLHLDGVRQVLECWDDWQTELWSPTAGLVALRTALEAPAVPGLRDAVEAGLRLVRRNQRADGSWPEADLFLALDALLPAGADAGADDESAAALRRGGALLAATQADDGTWGREAPGRRTLIGWRVLRHIVRRLEPETDARPAM